MGKYDHRSRDQKRKAKLKKKAERAQPRESLAYRGQKYKIDALVPTYLEVETAIYESFVMTDKQLTDEVVESALEELIRLLRQGALPPPSDSEQFVSGESNSRDFVVWNLRRHLRDLTEEDALPSRDDLIGILRTTLGSIEVWRSKSIHSRGYLKYIEGFLTKQVGVRVQRVTEQGKPLPAPQEDPLLELGRAWLVDHDPRAEAEFAERAEQLLRSGRAELVQEVCQQLIGETQFDGLDPDLANLALFAQELIDSGERPAPGRPLKLFGDDD